ncbi:hypothetical protein [Streptomyces sp. NPDC101249]|uniref:hypothetical protein n=1 Tax=Streptomyces sp. NPDC101249 TaxID=3366140 RepID=UPI0037FC96DB
MHRTTTTATLLVTVAVSALTGCVTVQRPPAPGPAATSAQPSSAPRPDGRGGAEVVQAPAREALEMTGPSPRDGHPPKHRAGPPPAGGAAGPAANPERPRTPHTAPRPHPRAADPGHRSRPHGNAPRPRVPDLVKGVPSSQADVCALGRTYGGWPADSPQAVVCGQTYGR